LNTHAAFFHYTTCAHRYVRIQNHSHGSVLRRINFCKFLVSLIVEPVEPAHFVRAVVGTISRSDTTVVGHLVDSLVAVCGSYNRTNRFAWSVITVLTKHRHVHHFRIVFRNFHLTVHVNGTDSFSFSFFLVHTGAEVAVDAQPEHIPGASYLVFTHHRNVVFRVTRYYTASTTDTGVQVNRHSPTVADVVHRMVCPQVNVTHVNFMISVIMVFTGYMIVLLIRVLLRSPVESQCCRWIINFFIRRVKRRKVCFTKYRAAVHDGVMRLRCRYRIGAVCS